MLPAAQLKKNRRSGLCLCLFLFLLSLFYSASPLQEHVPHRLLDVLYSKDISEPDVLRYGRQLASAMQYLHQKEILHCSLAAKNISSCMSSYSKILQKYNFFTLKHIYRHMSYMVHTMLHLLFLISLSLGPHATTTVCKYIPACVLLFVVVVVVVWGGEFLL